MTELIKQIAIRILSPINSYIYFWLGFLVKNNLKRWKLVLATVFIFSRLFLYCKSKKNPLFQTEIVAFGD